MTCRLSDITPCVWRRASTQIGSLVKSQPHFCKEAGCDGVQTEGIMRSCPKYVSEDDESVREAVWRSR